MKDKFIIVKTENSIRTYSSGWEHTKDEDGEWVEVERTDEEMEQRCYQNLISDIKRKEFEKNLISILSNYLTERQMANWTNIGIIMSYSDGKHCELNIGNPDEWKNWVLTHFEFFGKY